MLVREVEAVASSFLTTRSKNHPALFAGEDPTLSFRRFRNFRLSSGAASAITEAHSSCALRCGLIESVADFACKRDRVAGFHHVREIQLGAFRRLLVV